MRTPGPYYAAVAAFCAVCLIIGFAGAADQTSGEKIPCPKNWTGKDGDRAGHVFSAEEMIARLEQKGVDVTEVKAALEAGDTEAVKAWFAQQGRPDRGFMKGTPDFSALIARLEQKGVDVTEVKAALEAGDTEAVKAWFAQQGRPDRDSVKGTPFFSVLIARLEQKGVDVTEVKAALEAGNTEAVKAWFDAKRGEGRSGAGFPSHERRGNTRTGTTGE